MPRKPRNLLRGNTFHIIVKGIAHEKIFKNDTYKKRFLHFVRKYLIKFNVKILAYVVMDTHAHLMIYTNNICELSLFMHDVNQAYAEYYNFCNKRNGYVFEDRFFSKEILNERYRNACFQYIHNNPVNANVVNIPEKYKYSSFNKYLTSDDEIIDKESKNIMFGTFKRKEYIEKFYLIHRIYFNEKIHDVEEEVDYMEIINKYKMLGASDDLIVNRLYFEFKLSQEKIKKFLRVDRNKIRKILGTVKM